MEETVRGRDMIEYNLETFVSCLKAALPKEDYNRIFGEREIKAIRGYPDYIYLTTLGVRGVDYFEISKSTKAGCVMIRMEFPDPHATKMLPLSSGDDYIKADKWFINKYLCSKQKSIHNSENMKDVK